MTDTSLQKVPQIVSETITAIVGCKTMTEAAQILGIDRTTLYDRIDRYPEIKTAVEQIKEKARLTLHHGAFRAAEVLVEQLENRENRMEAAKEVLDRVGLTSKTAPVAVQVNNNLNTLEFTVDEKS